MIKNPITWMGIESSANRGPIGLPQPLLSRKFGSQELYNISGDETETLYKCLDNVRQ